MAHFSEIGAPIRCVPELSDHVREFERIIIAGREVTDPTSPQALALQAVAKEVGPLRAPLDTVLVARVGASSRLSTDASAPGELLQNNTHGWVLGNRVLAIRCDQITSWPFGTVALSIRRLSTEPNRYGHSPTGTRVHLGHAAFTNIRVIPYEHALRYDDLLHPLSRQQLAEQALAA